MKAMADEAKRPKVTLIAKADKGETLKATGPGDGRLRPAPARTVRTERDVKVIKESHSKEIKEPKEAKGPEVTEVLKPQEPRPQVRTPTRPKVPVKAAGAPKRVPAKRTAATVPMPEPNGVKRPRPAANALNVGLAPTPPAVTTAPSPRPAKLPAPMAPATKTNGADADAWNLVDQPF